MTTSVVTMIVNETAQTAELTEPGLLFDPTSIGGDYTSIQNDDGTWNILNVPILPEHDLPEIQGKRMGRRWLDQAILNAQQAVRGDKTIDLDSNFLPPLKVHHEGTGEAAFAGKFLPKFVRSMKFQGEDVDVLFADLLCIPDFRYQEIKAGMLPYRSAEFSLTKPLLVGLALLDHERSFFEMPLLTIGREIASQMAQRSFGAAGISFNRIDTEPLCATAAYRDFGAVLTKFEGERSMSDFLDDANPANRQDDADMKDKDDKTDDTTERQDTEGAAAKLAALAVNLTEAAGAVTEIASMLGGTPQADEEPPADDGQLAQLSLDERAPEDVATRSDDTGSTDIDPEKDGEIAGLKSRVAAMETAERVRKIEEAARADLKGYSVGKDEFAAIRELATKSGTDAVRTYVAAIKKHGSPEPTGNIADTLSGGGSGDDPAEVSEYATHGPEVLAAARELTKNYEGTKHMLGSISLRSYLYANIGRKLGMARN